MKRIIATLLMLLLSVTAYADVLNFTVKNTCNQTISVVPGINKYMDDSGILYLVTSLNRVKKNGESKVFYNSGRLTIYHITLFSSSEKQKVCHLHNTKVQMVTFYQTSADSDCVCKVE